MLEQVRLVLIAFAIGFLTRHFNPLNWSQIKEIVFVKLDQIPPTLLVTLGLLGTVLALGAFLWPLARIADWEAQKSINYKYRTSAREHLKRRGSFYGYLVGWNLGSGVLVVATKVGFANTMQISADLSAFQQHMQQFGISGQSLEPAAIIGYLSREGEGLCEIEQRDQSELWIDAFTARTQVAFRDVLSFGIAAPGRIIITVYDESIGKPWHYYAASPINLDLTAAPDTKDTSSQTSRSVEHIPLQRTLDYVNAAKELYTHIHTDNLRISQNNLEQPHESLIAHFEQIAATWSTWFLQLSDMSVAGVRVKKFSAVGQQLDLIVRRAMYAAEQRRAKCFTKQGAHGPHNAQYANFWNTAWVVALDIVLGCIVGTLLIVYSRAMSIWMLKALNRYTITSLEQTIVWLRGWPAGLKLNNGLDGFLAELFLWLIHFWTLVFQPFTRCMHAVVAIAGYAGFVGGCSMQLAILSDALALTTLHTYWFYIVATRIFHWQLITLYSLFNLFRGRKHNVLRNRIDSCDYNLDQLLIGTILFTLLTYLFPTVLVYYLTFVSRRLAVIMVQGLLEILLSLLNHCPAFYLTLRIRDPLMFPSGVCYEINNPFERRFIEAAWDMPGSPVRLSRDPIPLSARNRMNVTVLYMKSTPVPLSALFFQYYQIWVQFSASYLSQGILKSLVTGEVIRPVKRLQHTMIPGLTVDGSINH
ncbi:pig-Q [Coemansia brasiliensis]|uniref:Pig-Q n=1 Tax=Coemansia brasiliensis TaxID=2650707 RepID=A0A9W8I7Y5_9FUNG|nr:pig-Q [Coemansia brasiliensis]